MCKVDQLMKRDRQITEISQITGLGLGLFSQSADAQTTSADSATVVQLVLSD